MEGQATNFQSPTTDPVLLPEIWEKIFCGLSSNDFISVINAAPEWYHLLDSRKTTELFPFVLPHVLPRLYTQQLLACRGATLGSKAAVDSCLESNEQMNSFFSRVYEDCKFPQIVDIDESYSLNSRQHIDKLSNALSLQTKDASYNPFPTRSLTVGVFNPGDQDDEAQNEEDNHAAMTEFLTRYGTHIWRISFSFEGAVERSAIAKISSYLQHLPHLKILQLFREPEDRQLGHAELFGNSELPTLEHLCHLDFKVFSMHSVISTFIQSYGAQLTTLVVSGRWIKASQIEAAAFKSLLPKLKRLRVEEADQAVLEKLSVVDWPVECLRLELEIPMCERELHLSTISNFKESLTQLELNLLSSCDSENEEGDFDTEERASILRKEDDEATMIAEAAFQLSTKMEKLVAYWGTAAKRGDSYTLKIVKTQSANLAEETQYKISRASYNY